MNKTWTLEVQQDADGECYLEFPPDLLESVGWKEGDTVVWTELNNNTWTLTKKS